MATPSGQAIVAAEEDSAALLGDAGVAQLPSARRRCGRLVLPVLLAALALLALASRLAFLAQPQGPEAASVRSEAALAETLGLADVGSPCGTAGPTLAGKYTCASRVSWLLAHGTSTQALAGSKVASEFPAECGPCAGSATTAPAATQGPIVGMGFAGRDATAEMENDAIRDGNRDMMHHMKNHEREKFQNDRQRSRPTPRPRGPVQCVDTPGWTDGQKKCKHDMQVPNEEYCTTEGKDKYRGWTCQGYVYKGWCANGQVTGTDEAMFNTNMNSPASNCCECGKGGGR